MSKQKIVRKKKGKQQILRDLKCFLLEFLCIDSLDKVDPKMLRKFLIYKENKGKKQVHGDTCKFLNCTGVQPCSCPNIFAAGTVKNLVYVLKIIFKENGKGSLWDEQSQSGNPACSPVIDSYVKSVCQTLAQAAILPTQVRPLFISKLRLIMEHINNKIKNTSETRQLFILFRDKAFFCLQHFAGDRCIDICRLRMQDFRVTDEHDGIVINRSFSKSIRGGDSKANTFILKILSDFKDICPVKALKDFVAFLQSIKLVYTTGFIFRVLTKEGFISGDSVSHAIIYKNLKAYLSEIGSYEGETLHSLRSGFAISMLLSDNALLEEEVAGHVGWSDNRSLLHYSRIRAVNRAQITSEKIVQAIRSHKAAENTYKDFESLEC